MTAEVHQGQNSAATLKALAILRAAGRPMLAREFAREMWPNSEGWERSKEVSWYGSSKGAGMTRAALGLLGRMRKQGLVRAIYPPGGRCTRWEIL